MLDMKTNIEYKGARKMHKNKNIQKNVRRRLFRIVSAEFFQQVSKEDIIKYIDGLENYKNFKEGEFKNFKTKVKNLEDEQWKILISQHNTNIKQKIEMESLKTDSFNKLVSIIEKDNVLKYHNICFGINNFGIYGKNYFVIKIYLACGVYFVEGTLEEIVEQIKFELKENNVKIRVFCIACSSKRVSFMNQYCLCHDCGTVFDIDNNRIIEKYDIKDKDFWNAKFINFKAKNA